MSAFSRPWTHDRRWGEVRGLLSRLLRTALKVHHGRMDLRGLRYLWVRQLHVAWRYDVWDRTAICQRDNQHGISLLAPALIMLAVLWLMGGARLCMRSNRCFGGVQLDIRYMPTWRGPRADSVLPCMRPEALGNAVRFAHRAYFGFTQLRIPAA